MHAYALASTCIEGIRTIENRTEAGARTKAHDAGTDWQRNAEKKRLLEDFCHLNQLVSRLQTRSNELDLQLSTTRVGGGACAGGTAETTEETAPSPDPCDTVQEPAQKAGQGHQQGPGGGGTGEAGNGEALAGEATRHAADEVEPEAKVEPAASCCQTELISDFLRLQQLVAVLQRQTQPAPTAPVPVDHVSSVDGVCTQPPSKRKGAQALLGEDSASRSRGVTSPLAQSDL